MNKRPNILIFMTDHQRGDTIFKENGTIMPNLNKLMENGITFSECFCPTPHCCPSRATFFTGLYPSQHGIWNNVHNGMALAKNLKQGVRLFSEELKDAGYRLSYAGKWHVSYDEDPAHKGFEELFVSAKSGNNHATTWEAIERNAQTARQDWEKGREEGKILRKGYTTDVLYGRADEGSRHDDTSVAQTANKIREYAKDPDTPWCAMVGTSMPHAPYWVPQKYLDMYPIETIDLPESYYDTLEDKPNYYRKLRQMRFAQLTELEYKQAIRHFRAMCTYLDDLFGQLMDALRETGQLDNTLVLFTSDHGDYLGEHGLFHKGVPAFRGAYHIPGVISWPAGIKNPDRVISELVSLADFAPTFLEAAGIKTDNEMVGQSLMPFLEDRNPDTWRDAIFTQCNGVENYFTQRSVITKEYRYTYNGFDFDELYDLRVDPNEMTNKIHEPSYETTIKELCKKMWQFARQTDDQLPTSGNYITIATAAYGPGVVFN